MCCLTSESCSPDCSSSGETCPGLDSQNDASRRASWGLQKHSSYIIEGKDQEREDNCDVTGYSLSADFLVCQILPPTSSNIGKKAVGCGNFVSWRRADF